jgi:MEMO1 family protein
MSDMERPQLRPYLAPTIDQTDPEQILLYDRIGLADQPCRVSRQELKWLQLFDGRRTVDEIHAEAKVSGPLERLQRLVKGLEEGLFLDGPRFQERLADPVRAPSCIGCYEGDPDALRRQLRGLFIGRQGPGLPRDCQPDGRLRAALIPHIDYHRGGHSFAWGFKEVAERTDAALFVIIGTSHYSPARFTLTRKHFRTPLGITPTDQGYIDRLVRQYGPGLFDDELTHLPEHSIELEVVFLQYLYENRRPIRIVPLLAGTFQDCVAGDLLPSGQHDIGRMIAALRQVEAETNEPICYIISGDLAHIGPKFGDHAPVDEALVTYSRYRDQAILRQAEAADPDEYFHVICAEADCRRICGLPPTYTLLKAVGPSHGKALHYGQYVHPAGYESVSYASMAFYR